MKTNKEWLKSKDLIELSEMLKALAHPSRIGIMHILCRNEVKKHMVKDIYNELRLAQPVISRHLGILRKTHLVKRTMEGPITYYELNTENKFTRQISQCFSTLKLI
jgi:DNA-binding transcriptional ArsR family regulator